MTNETPESDDTNSIEWPQTTPDGTEDWSCPVCGSNKQQWNVIETRNRTVTDCGDVITDEYVSESDILYAVCRDCETVLENKESCLSF